MTRDEGLKSTGLRVPWSVLTIGLATIAIGSLGTLVVVASVQDVDALSTVALALAVLAFAAQLIVSLAQASAGAQQIAQAERINAATQSALADLRATSSSQLANQKDLFTQVLRAALPEVAQEISDDASVSRDGAPELDVAAIEARLESAVNRAIAWVGHQPQVPVDNYGSADNPDSLIRHLRAGERRLADSRLKDLSDGALRLLRQLGVMLVNNSTESLLYFDSPKLPSSSLEELLKADLITISREGDSSERIGLSSIGRLCATQLLSFSSIESYYNVRSKIN